MCAPLNTHGDYSCGRYGHAAINHTRWVQATEEFPDLTQYRQYVVNHEVGHLLGRQHVSCPAAGELAPIMQQQSIRVAPCLPNAWPFPGRAAHSAAVSRSGCPPAGPVREIVRVDLAALPPVARRPGPRPTTTRPRSSRTGAGRCWCSVHAGTGKTPPRCAWWPTGSRGASCARRRPLPHPDAARGRPAARRALGAPAADHRASRWCGRRRRRRSRSCGPGPRCSASRRPR